MEQGLGTISSLKTALDAGVHQRVSKYQMLAILWENIGLISIKLMVHKSWYIMETTFYEYQIRYQNIFCYNNQDFINNHVAAGLNS